MTDPNTDGAQPDAEAGQEPATPATEPERNAEEDENRGKLIASLQEKASRVNTAEAEAKFYKTQLDAMTRAQSPAARGGDPRAERAKLVRDFAEGRVGDAPDPVAADYLDFKSEVVMTFQEMLNKNELERITDEDKRRRVTETFNNNRTRFGDVDAAKRYVEAEEFAKANAEKDEEIARLRKVLEAGKRPGPDVVQTHTREVPAAEHNDKMTQAQWNDRAADLTRRRDEGDEAAKRELYKMQLARRDNKLKVEG
jgi:hypothetical protein